MKPAPFDYVAPRELTEALDHLNSGDDVTILAGGQTLMPLLALRMSTPSVLIDINRIDALKGIERTGTGIKIGPVMRQNELLASDLLATSLPLLVEATRHVGHHQTRNRGTIGGSISFGEPAAELPAAAVALGASIEAHSPNGTRHIAADEFYTGPYSTVLEPNEMVTAIHFPERRKGSIDFFREVTRRPGDFALVGVMGSLTIESGKIGSANIVWFGMGPTPIKARQAEAALAGQSIGTLDFKGIAELAVSETEPFDDHHATSEYRRTVGKRVLARALSEAVGRA
jgi:aerobic carbon-monoxide dehydrogenase medium subunit